MSALSHGRMRHAIMATTMTLRGALKIVEWQDTTWSNAIRTCLDEHSWHEYHLLAIYTSIATNIYLHMYDMVVADAVEAQHFDDDDDEN